jgi:hypothetical protein
MFVLAKKFVSEIVTNHERDKVFQPHRRWQTMNEDTKDTTVQTQTTENTQTPAPATDTTPAPAPAKVTETQTKDETNSDIVNELANLRKMLEDQRKENQKIKFEAYKTTAKAQFGVDDDAFDLLGIGENTAEKTANEKLTKFSEMMKTTAEKANENKDSNVFFTSPVQKTTSNDKIQQLIKEGKVNEALAMKLTGK